MVRSPARQPFDDRRSTMRRPLAATLLVLLAWSAGAALAQPLQVGNLVTTANAGDLNNAVVRTDVDFVRPATATGTLDSATFRWSGGCVGAVKLKFFRRQGDTLIYRTERGPFDGLDTATVALVPPVEVEEGDLIGITRVLDCGNPVVNAGFPTAGYAQFGGDVTADVALAAALGTSADTLAVYATGDAVSSVARVIPVVGSTPGAFDSFFRTGVQLYNPSSSPLTGTFVYHPAGTSGSSSDPSEDFTIPPGSVLSYADLVETMGQVGLGSIDVVLPADGQVPIVVTRVFNDAGTAGTAGFTEDLLDPDNSSTVLFAGSTSFLLAPADAVDLRLNIGVRTFFSGVTMTIAVRNSAGVLVRTVSKTLPPTYFIQQSADVFLEGPVGANDVIEISVSSGSAVVYGATTDNTTNDPSIQFARVAFAVL
jgi:hypothetical protein